MMREDVEAGAVAVNKERVARGKKTSRRPQCVDPGHPSLRDEAKALFRAGVLRAAEDVFAEKGYYNTRIQDIAERARVAVGTVYNYFKEKDEILVAILVEQGEEVFGLVETKPGDPKDFEGAFRAKLGRTLAFLAQHRNFMRVSVAHGLFALPDTSPLMGGMAGLEPVAEQRRRHADIMVNMLREGVEEGIFENYDLGFLHHFFFGAISSVLAGAVCDPKADLVQQGNLAMDLFFRAVRPSSR
jgi:AcrR family transcriptional regulator